MKLNGQQWVFKNIVFSGTKTGVIAGGTDIIFLGCQFNNGRTGIDAVGTSGSLTVVDSSASGLEHFVIAGKSEGAGNSVILENVQNNGATVTVDGNTLVSGSIENTWVRGDLVRDSCFGYMADDAGLTVRIV